MQDISKILLMAYDKFLLNLGGKKVPTPYRINIPYQSDRRLYGKSNPEELISNTIQIAKDQNFDLGKSTVEEIRNFMKKNMLGIDCSGFVYHILDFLLNETGKGGMEAIGYPCASQTNVTILTSDQFAISIRNFSDAKSGDIIKLSGTNYNHCALILKNKDDVITYAHSSESIPDGVHLGKIEYGNFPDDLKNFIYNKSLGDGIKRLKALNQA